MTKITRKNTGLASAWTAYVLLALLLIAGGEKAYGQAYTWTGLTDGNWTTATNWNPATGFPGSAATSDTALFNAVSTNTTVTVGTPANPILSVTFDTALCPAYTLQAGTLIIGPDASAGAITVTSTVTTVQTISANITLGTAVAQTVTISNSSAQIFTISGTITGGTGGTAAGKTLATAGTGSMTLSGNITKGSATNVTITNTNTATVIASGTNGLVTLNLNSTGIYDVVNGTTTISDSGGNSIQSSITSGTATLNSSGTGGFILSQNGTSTTDGPDCGVANGGTLTINAKIGNANNGFEFFRTSVTTGLINLTNANNNFGFALTTNQGIVNVTSIGNQGIASSPVGTNTMINLGTVGVFRYSGAGETTNRILNMVGGTGTPTLDMSGTGALKYNTAMQASGAGVHTLTLQGSTTGTGEIAAAIVQNSATNTTNVLKQGSGTWTISGANSYTGGTTVNAGTLVLGASTSLTTTQGPLTFGASSTGTLTLNGFNAGVTNVNSNATVGTPLITNASATAATLTVAPNAASAYAGAISDGAGGGALSLTENGTSSQTLSGTLTYTGATTVSSGSLFIDGTSTGSNFTVNSGGTLGGKGSIAGTVSESAGGSIQAGSLATPGTLTLNSATNPLTVTGNGALNFRLFASPGGANDLINAPNGPVTVTTATVVNISVGSTFTNGGTYTLVTSPNTQAGVIPTVGSKPAGSTVVLANNGTSITATVTLNVTPGSGTFIWNGNGANSNWSTAANWIGGVAPNGTGTETLIFQLPSTQFTANNDLTGPNTFTQISITAGGFTLTGNAVTLGATANAMSVVTPSGNTTINLAIGGAGAGLTATPTGGTLTLTAANTYTGTTTFSAGTVLLSGGANRLPVTTTLIFGGTTTFNTGGNAQSITTLQLNNVAQTVTLAGTSVTNPLFVTSTSATIVFPSGSGLVTTNLAGGFIDVSRGTIDASGFGINANSSEIINLTSSLVGSGGLTIKGYGNNNDGVGTGSNALNVNGTNLFTGGVTLTSGLVFANSDASFGATGQTVTITGTGGLGMSAGGTITLPASRGFILSGTGDKFFRQYGSNILIINGIISGAGTLHKVDGGTLVLNGANTYTGGTIVGQGILNINSDASLGAVPGAPATNLTLNGAGTLQAGVTGIVLNANRNINNNGNTLTVDTQANTMTIAGVISGASGVSKIGNGTLITTGNNTYAGSTVVNTGALRVDGINTGTGVYTISSVLGGIGTIPGNVTISGGTLAPGDTNTPGTLTLTSASTPHTFSGTTPKFNVRLFGAPGTSDDLVNVPNGAITFTTTPTVNVTLGGAVSSGSNYIVLQGGNVGAGGPSSATVVGGTATVVTTAGAGGNITVTPTATAATGAGPFVWTGATSNSWSLGSNWLGGNAPASGNAAVLIFPQGAVSTTPNNDFAANSTFAQIQVQAGGYTFSGNAVNLGATATALTFTPPSGTVIWGIPLGATAAVINVAADPSAIVALNAANLNTGTPATIVSGTAQLGSATPFGTAAVAVAVTSGATVDLNGQAITNPFTAAAGAGVGGLGAIINSNATAASATGTFTQGTTTFTVGGTGNITLGQITGTAAFSITKVGTNTLTLGGTTDNAFMSLTANAGTVVLAKAPSSGTVHALGGSNAVVINSGATVQLGGSGGDQITSGNPVTINAGGTFDVNGMTESVDLLTGAGTLNNSAATAGTFTTSSTNSGTFAGVIENTGAGVLNFSKAGTGTLVLNGINTYSGLTTISAGVLQISSTANLGDASSTNTITLGAATLDSTSGIYDLGINRTITLSGAGVIQTDAGTLTISGNITNGTNLLTFIGNGSTVVTGVIGTGATPTGNVQMGSTTAFATVTLSGNNLFTGTVTFPGANTQPFAVLTVTNSGAFGAGSKTVSAAGGGEIHLQNNITIPSTISFTTSGNPEQNNNTAANRAVIYNDSGNNTIA